MCELLVGLPDLNVYPRGTEQKWFYRNEDFQESVNELVLIVEEHDLVNVGFRKPRTLQLALRERGLPVRARTTREFAFTENFVKTEAQHWCTNTTAGDNFNSTKHIARIRQERIIVKEYENLRLTL